MRIWTLLAAAGAAFVALSLNAVAAPTTVFGLPLGGKVKMPIPKCPARAAETGVQSLCWESIPNTIMGGRSGWAQVPGEDQMPRWAAHGFFEPRVKNDGTLESLVVKTSSADQFVEILNSISGRFGQSQRESRPGSAIMTADWTRDDIHIKLLCSASIGCNTTFISGVAHAAHLRELAKRKARDAARAATP